MRFVAVAEIWDVRRAAASDPIEAARSKERSSSCSRHGSTRSPTCPAVRARSDAPGLRTSG